MARNVSEASRGSGEITANIAGVAQAADSTSRGSSDTRRAAQELVQTSAQLRNLIEQFKIGRRDPRIAAALPVQLTGTDASGRPLNQKVMTIDVSHRGALLMGIDAILRRGAIISLARVDKKEDFRVAWVGAKGTPEAGQTGVSSVGVNTSFWNDVLETPAAPERETASASAIGGRRSKTARAGA